MLCFQSNLWAQTFDLSDELDEISGLEMLNDSTFVALNDGGHEATLYLLNIRGKIIKKVKIENAKNVDWEDIAVDDKNIYIADVGNNTNKRKDLLI